jgi:hypothetical protein
MKDYLELVHHARTLFFGFLTISRSKFPKVPSVKYLATAGAASMTEGFTEYVCSAADGTGISKRPCIGFNLFTVAAQMRT